LKLEAIIRTKCESWATLKPATSFRCWKAERLFRESEMWDILLLSHRRDEASLKHERDNNRGRAWSEKESCSHIYGVSTDAEALGGAVAVAAGASEYW
jgi:hypothetical protein